MTTNFDEHVETLCAGRFKVETPTTALNFAADGPPLLIKMHGTISSKPSMAFTLEQYDTLRERNGQIIQRLSNQPLLIAGYSGYDTDLFPALSKLVEDAPFTVILKHPGQGSNEPILTLASTGTKVIVIEANCSDVFSILAAGLEPPRSPQAAPKGIAEEAAAIYRRAGELVELYECPFIILQTFSLAWAWGEIHRYAWLTHDACCDAREREEIDPRVFRSIHLKVAYALKLAGDPHGSRIMIGVAKQSLDATHGGLSEAGEILRTEAMIENAPSRGQAPEDAHSVTPSLPFPPSAVLAADDQMRQRSTPHDTFARAWQLGIARSREGNHAGAIEAFEPGLEAITKGVVTHLESGRFLLDYGAALFGYAMENESDDFRNKANTAYHLCAAITAKGGDWATNAKAHLMLAKIFISAGQVERARTSIMTAMESAARTGDLALRSRIEEFRQVLDQLNGELRE